MISLASLPLYRQYGRKWLMEKGHITVRIDESEVLVRPRSYDLYVLGEVFREQVYAPTLRPQLFPRVIADLGAHIGAFTLWAAGRWKGARITAVEMEAENFALLQKNIALNHLDGRVSAIHAAVWDSHSPVTVSRHGFNQGMHRATPTSTADEIPTLTLSQLIQSPETEAIDILKIDIEGSEARILGHPNSAFLSTKVRYIVAEIHPTVSRHQIASYLEASGFAVTTKRQWFRRAAILHAVNRSFSYSS